MGKHRKAPEPKPWAWRLAVGLGVSGFAVFTSGTAMAATGTGSDVLALALQAAAGTGQGAVSDPVAALVLGVQAKQDAGGNTGDQSQPPAGNPNAAFRKPDPPQMAAETALADPGPSGRLPTLDDLHHYVNMGTITFTDNAGCQPAADAFSGKLQEGTVAAMVWLARNGWTFEISCFVTGHSQNVAGTDRESLHPQGKAFDISQINGEAVSPKSGQSRRFFNWLMSQPNRYLPWEVGSPFAPGSRSKLLRNQTHGAAGGPFFTDGGHQNHFHIGSLAPSRSWYIPVAKVPAVPQPAAQPTQLPAAPEPVPLAAEAPSTPEAPPPVAEGFSVGTPDFPAGGSTTSAPPDTDGQPAAPDPAPAETAPSAAADPPVPIQGFVIGSVIVSGTNLTQAAPVPAAMPQPVIAPPPASQPAGSTYDRTFDVTLPSGLTADQLNSALADTWLAGHGRAFADIEGQNGVNALFAAAHALQEGSRVGSHWRQPSQIVREHNNVFGLNAVDSNPEAAFNYASIDDCIRGYGSFLSQKYLAPGGDFYNGTSIHGIFVRYSTSHDAEADSIASIMNALAGRLAG